MITTMLWDYGGVFSTSPLHALDSYAATLGGNGHAMIDIVLGYHQADGDHHWHRLERGEITMKEAFELTEAAVEASGIEGFSVGEFFKSMGGTGHPRDEMFAGVARLKAAGTRHAILSNNVAEIADRWRSTLPDDLFADIIDSSAVGVRKPDPAIYELTLERMGATPAETVFLDDHPANVEAAQALGITGIHVGPNPLEALAEAEALIINKDL